MAREKFLASAHRAGMKGLLDLGRVDERYQALIEGETDYF